MSTLILLLISSVFLGANVLAIDLGVASLSMYRLLFLIVAALSFLKVLIEWYDKEIILNEIAANQYIKIYGIWTLYAMLSVLWAASFTGWIKGTFFVSMGSFSILFISLFIKKKIDLKRSFLAVFIMIGLHQLVGWIEILTNIYFWADMEKLDRHNTFVANSATRTPITTFANQNDYATLLVAGIAVSFIIYLNTESVKMKMTAVLSTLSSIYLIMRTVSRANFLALVLFFVSLVIIKGFKQKNYEAIIKTIIGLLLFLIAVYVMVSPVREAVNSQLVLLSETSFAEGRSNRTRINLILNGFVFLFSSFGLGVGAGNVEYWMDNFRIFSTGGVEADIVNMHNWFMEILTAYGLIIFILYAGMYLFMLRRLYLNYMYSNKLFIRQSSYIILAYMIAFLISSASSANNIFIEWQWILWGIIIAFLRYSENDRGEKTDSIS